jgi:general secretion pathway protein L
MKVITIDWGSYSAKIIHSQVDKKKISHDFIDEVIFEHRTFDGSLPKWEAQLHQIQNYLITNINPDSKVILSTPSELLSFRFKNLPVNQSKKALAMLPFQIEDDIPFNLNDTYLTATLLKQKKSFDALCYFAKKDKWQKCLDLIIDKSLPIHSWIHPIDPIATFAHELPFLNDISSTCLLDIGHETTKAYFFQGKKFHSYQISHFGGSRIDEMMSSIYQISYDQLKKFKHESSFIVPKELFSATKLSDDQKFFAENMDTLFYSFIQEFKRWEMSFRVETKDKVSQIYLTGGTALIKNLDQYLSYYWERPVQLLQNSSDSFDRFKNQSKKNTQFIPSDLLTLAHKQLSKMSNHLGKVILSKAQDPLPLYSIGFVAIRTSLLSLLCLTLGIIYFTLLTNKESSLDKQLKAVTQNVQLEFSAVEKSQIYDNPKIVIKKIENKIKSAKNDLRRINQLNQVNALFPLRGIQTALLGTSCFINNFESNDSNSGQFQIADCNEENSNKIKNVLSKQSNNYTIKSLRNNTIEGSF